MILSYILIEFVKLKKLTWIDIYPRLQINAVKNQKSIFMKGTFDLIMMLITTFIALDYYLTNVISNDYIMQRDKRVKVVEINALT